MVRGRKGEYSTLLDDLAKQGYARVRVDGEILELADRASLDLARYEQHTIEVVVDRLIRKARTPAEGLDRDRPAPRRRGRRDPARGRLRTPPAPGRPTSQVDRRGCRAPGDESRRAGPRPTWRTSQPRTGSQRREELADEQVLDVLPAPGLHALRISLDELAPRNFSFNSPYGACPACTGLGTRFEVDPDLVVPNPDLSLSHGAIGPLGPAPPPSTSPACSKPSLSRYGFSMDKPWSKLSKAQRKVLLFGAGRRLHPCAVPQPIRDAAQLRHPVRGRRAVAPEAAFRSGLRMGPRAGRGLYAGEVPCPTCGGTRLRPESLAVKVGGRSIAELSALSIRAAHQLLGTLALTPREEMYQVCRVQDYLDRVRP